MSRIELRKRKCISYYLELNKFKLIEENDITGHTFVYDILDTASKKFFQERVLFNARYNNCVRMDSYCLYYLHFIRWL